jgi:predicted permease
METILKDIRYGVRSLLKHPGFTAVAVLTLALGVGANTTIFSLVNNTLMKSLPVSHPESLVYVFNGTPGNVFSYPDYVELRDRNQVVDGLSAWGGITASLNSNDQTDLVVGAIVTGNYFEVLGVNAALGRMISRADDQTPGAHPVTVISDGLWKRRFGADPNIVGKQLLLNGYSFTIIGVAPEAFSGAQLGNVRDLYVPMMMQATMRPPRAGYSGEMNPDLLNVRRNRWLFSVGRLKPGVSIEQAQTSLAAIAKELELAYPDTNRGRGISVSPFRDTDTPETRRQLGSVALLLMSVVGLVLLIACANVANLLLARGSARTKEIAVRLAIGATRGRIVRQLLTESVLLATLGGGLGLLLAWWAASSWRAVPPPPGALPVTPNFVIDLQVLLFTLGLSILAGIIFGLAPALRASSPELTPALKDASWSATDRKSYFSLRSFLVVTQVALSVVLLIAAGLFLRSLRQTQAVEPGFAAEKVLTLPLNINLLRYTKPQGREFYRQAIERVQAIPGVESVSLARVVALSGGSSVRSLLIQGRVGREEQFRREDSGGGSFAISDNSTSSNVVALDYFRTMGIGLLRGRDFNVQDKEEGARVVIVNEAFVQRHFPGQEPLGQYLSFNGPGGPWAEIIGVVRDSKYLSLRESPTPLTYLPLAQNHETGMDLHVRASNPSALSALIRQELQSLDRNLPLTSPAPISESISNSLYTARIGALLIGIFGGLALLLASIGLYGVMSFAVSRRTRELGIRMALGAQAADVFSLVLRQGLGMVLLGLAIGLVAAAIVTRLLTSFLFGIKPLDPITFVVISFLLVLVAVVACFIPARRATKVDPLVALRYE